jgi:hypothetical protein
MSFIAIAGPTTAAKFARDVSDGGYAASIRQRSARSAQKFGRISRNAIRTSKGVVTIESARIGSNRIRSYEQMRDEHGNDSYSRLTSIVILTAACQNARKTLSVTQTNTGLRH